MSDRPCVRRPLMGHPGIPQLEDPGGGEGDAVDATGITLAVATVLFLGWLLAPSRRSAEAEADPSPHPE